MVLGVVSKRKLWRIRSSSSNGLMLEIPVISVISASDS